MRRNQFLAIGFIIFLSTFLLGASVPRAYADTIVPTTISSDTEWTLAGSPYLIQTPTTITTGATLTIDAGVVVKSFANPDGFSALDVLGKLLANGSANSKIVFTSIADDTIAGDTNADATSTIPENKRWGNILFENTTATSTLSFVDFRYGGSSGNSNSVLLSTQGSHVLISDSTFESVPGYQMTTGGMAYTEFERDNFLSQNYVVRLWTGSSDAAPTTVVMHDSSMNSVNANPLDYHNGPFFLSLQNNWWGNVSGPYDATNNPTGSVNVGYSGSAVTVTPFLTCDPATDAACLGPKTDSVLFLPGAEGSRLYYRDLFNSEHQVWEPDFYTDIPYLKMNTDGTSQYNLYTKDIIGGSYSNNSVARTAALQLVNTNDLDIYGGLETYMDSLVASSTVGMHEWRAYPYDWRYDVRDVVANGTQTEVGGAVQTVKLADIVAQMAAASATGKVTIIGHSNGGLLAKALVNSLGASASTTIDKIIMVGTPQWGTPQAIGALLHGDNLRVFPWIVMTKTTGRDVQSTMPDPYDLLPSSTYFSHVATPVATFEATTTVSGPFATALGTTLTTLSGLQNFLEDVSNLSANVGDTSDLRAPLPLPATLVSTGAATHAVLDVWTPPTGIAVTAIAGWGQETLSGLKYTTVNKAVCSAIGITINACGTVATLSHEPILTQDGDGTVVSQSAVGDTGNTFYFAASKFRDDGHGNYIHSNITSASPVQASLTGLITGTMVSTSVYLSQTKPSSAANSLIVVSSHSPVNLLITDGSGNRSGVASVMGTDFPLTLIGIPGSSVQVLGDEQYVYLPASGFYTVSVVGYDAGPAAINVGTVGSDGIITTTQSFTQLPIVSGTLLALSINGLTATSSPLTIDEDADGTIDATLELGTATSTVYTPPAPVVTTPVTSAQAPSNSSSNGSISIPSVVSAVVSFFTPTPTSVPVQRATTISTVISRPSGSSPEVSGVASVTHAESEVTGQPQSKTEPITITSIDVAPGPITIATVGADGQLQPDNTSQAAAVSLAPSLQVNSDLASALYNWLLSLWLAFLRFLAWLL